MSDGIPGYDGWKLRAPDDERPERSFGWMRCEECAGWGGFREILKTSSGGFVAHVTKCEACAGCGGIEVDEDDLDWSES